MKDKKLKKEIEELLLSWRVDFIGANTFNRGKEKEVLVESIYDFIKKREEGLQITTGDITFYRDKRGNIIDFEISNERR